MAEWINGLTTLQKVFFYAAAPASALIILTGLVSMIGIEIDSLTNIDIGFDDTLGLFNIRGILAFFAIGGIVGLAMSIGGLPDIYSIAGGLASGALSMKLFSSLMKIAKADHSGNIKTENAIGKVGEVYLTIPPERKDKGKVNLLLQGRLAEFDAVTQNSMEIKNGDKVLVIGIEKENTLLVVPDGQLIEGVESAAGIEAPKSGEQIKNS